MEKRKKEKLPLKIYITIILYGQNLHDFAIPLITGVLVNIFLPKVGKENLITPLGLIMLFLFIATEKGITLHTFRPWNT